MIHTQAWSRPERGLQLTLSTRLILLVGPGLVLFNSPSKAQQASAPPTAPTIQSSKLVDLTYSFGKETIYWPTDPSFSWKSLKWGPSPGGYWYASASFSASEHGGTHLDSPIHFAEKQPTVDQIPLSQLVGPAVVVNVQAECEKQRDYALLPRDLEAWEQRHGPIPAGAIVLMHSGWGRYWPDKTRYLGTNRPRDTKTLHFPGLSREAAEWLVKRKVAGVGVDTASLDPGSSREFMAHRVLNGAGIYGIENVANLEKLPEAGATLLALPMKIEGGSGAPTRVIAILP